MPVLSFFSNKRIMVTGACGSIGAQLIQLLLQSGSPPAEIIGLDNNESGLFFLEQRFLAYPQVNFFLTDIRDRETLCRRMQGVDIVFHTAAFKHVFLCEKSPFEAVQTNIYGVQNIIYAASENQVEKVIFTSSDKAVNPTNVMGTSKLMGERLITAANSSQRLGGPVFSSTRFGNVLGSSGSVVPVFHRQIAGGGPVTLTHRDMTRFIMSIDQAVALVLDSARIARGGGVFITKMPVVRIIDLAEVMIRELAPRYGYQAADIAIEEIGIKPGEKLYEELMSSEETRRAVELNDYFVVLPAFRGMYSQISYEYEDLVSDQVTNPYVSSSEPLLSQAALTTFLSEAGLLDPGALPDDQPARRYWPGEQK
jgi:FlaA1/EpsC-like NDP-sugar epimerase